METTTDTHHLDQSLHLLMSRHSTPVARLAKPGPSSEQIDLMVRSAVRVPDHGCLEPWRIIHIDDNDRMRFAEAIVICHRSSDPEAAEAVLEKDRQRFGNSPSLLVVIGSIEKNHRIPEREQLLSGGCVCFGLLQAANAIGFGAQWLTGWAAYDDGVAKLLGLDADECILGFIHMGTVSDASTDRVRPDPDALLSTWSC